MEQNTEETGLTESGQVLASTHGMMVVNTSANSWTIRGMGSEHTLGRVE